MRKAFLPLLDEARKQFLGELFVRGLEWVEHVEKAVTFLSLNLSLNL